MAYLYASTAYSTAKAALEASIYDFLTSCGKVPATYGLAEQCDQPDSYLIYEALQQWPWGVSHDGKVCAYSREDIVEGFRAVADRIREDTRPDLPALAAEIACGFEDVERAEFGDGAAWRDGLAMLDDIRNENDLIELIAEIRNEIEAMK